MKLWTRKWIFNANASDEQFLFIHIPKTAGTTFRNILYNHFETDDIYPLQVDLKNNGGKYLSQKEIINDPEISNKTLIAGHLNINILNHLSPSIKTIVFFRNPLDRIFSMIKHLKKHDPLFQNGDPNEIVAKRFDHIMSVQSAAMGFNLKTKNYPIIRQNIVKLDFIGISEYFEASLQLCNATFGWQLENIKPRNVIVENIYSQLTPQTMANISRAIAPELSTYNIAINHFIKRCNDHNIEIPINIQ